MKFVNKNILLSLKLFVTTMQLLSLSSFIFFISFNFPQKEKYYATGTNEHKRAHETGAQGA